MLTIRPLSSIRDGAAVKCHIISPSFHTSHSDSFSSLILSVVVLTSKRVRVIHTTGTQDLRVPWNPHTKIHLNMLSGSSRKLLSTCSAGRAASYCQHAQRVEPQATVNMLSGSSRKLLSTCSAGRAASYCQHAQRVEPQATAVVR